MLTATDVTYLLPIAGPSLGPIKLVPAEDALVIGRQEGVAVRLPQSAEQVSRQHARFSHDAGQWRLSDLGSRWGTFVNGVRLAPQVDMPLREGDLVRINPWTFAVSGQNTKAGVSLKEDTGQTMVRSISSAPATRQLAEDLLALLLETASALHAAVDESELATRLTDAAVRGTGLANAVLLRPVDAAGHFEVIAAHGAAVYGAATGSGGGGAQFSRSLITAAADGEVVELSGVGPTNTSQSIVQLRINAAVCVPLMLGNTPAAFLYLDSRGSIAQTLRPGATAFCVALGRMASLALANLKRVEMEKRESQIHAELAAAAAAQKWIMPARHKTFGQCVAIGESRPGQFVGGDFFDLMELPEGRVGMALGDVSGKGVSASVLMTAAQGFLHASLEQFAEPGKAVTALNRFIAPRRPANKFVTMWVGVIDRAQGLLHYVDAGHSYALLKRSNGEIVKLAEGSGLPVGVLDDTEYTAVSVPIAAGDRVLVVSDGIIEQPAPRMIAGERQEFDLAGVERVFRDDRSLARSVDPACTADAKTLVPDEVAALFAAVFEHAATEQLADDATAVCVTVG